MSSAKKNLIIIFITIGLYLLHFVILPIAVADQYPTGSIVGLVLLITLFLWCIVAHYWLKCRMLMWIVAEVIYAFAVLMYNGRGLYGIGMTGIAADGQERVYDIEFALIMVGLLTAFMFLEKIALIIIDFMFKKIKQAVKAKRAD